jgi:putative ABC transport system permease protein
VVSGFSRTLVEFDARQSECAGRRPSSSWFQELSTMWLNLVHTVRHLRRRPVLTAVGIISLAIGIGCALACASVVNAVLFRAFPYRDADRLVLVWENNAKRGVGLTPTSILNYRDLKDGATSFENLGAFGDEVFSLDGTDRSERAFGYRVTAGVLEQTCIAPMIGRLFTAAEDQPGGADVVVLSHGLWQRRFGGDPQILGRQIRLTGVPHTVIGVMPRGFMLPPIFSVRLVGVDIVMKEADLWVPYKLDDFPQQRDARFLFMLGHLKPGRSVAAAQAEASGIAHRLATDYSVDDFGLDFTVVPLETQVLSSVRTLLFLLLLVGALVLIIAATDAAHLLLADSLTMTGETAVRSALGASPWRLASQQGTLSVTWCALATIGALVVAAAIQSPVAAYAKANVPRLNEVRFDGTVGVTALALGAAVALGISLLPIAYARKTAATRSMSGTAAPVGMPRWRRLFVIVQLAVAIVVMSTAALLFRSADALAQVNPGFAAENVSVFELMLPESRYATPARRVEFQRRVLEQLADVASAKASATVDFLPLAGETAVINFTIENHVPVNIEKKPRAALRAVSRSYFDVLAIPAIDGRRFVAGDEGGSDAVIVNDAFVRRFLPDADIIGRRIKRGEATSQHPWMTVVGVVGSVRGAGLSIEPQPEVFVPYVRGNIPRAVVSVIVKSALPPQALAPAVVERIHRVDAALSPTTVTNMTELVGRASGQPVFYARLFGLLAAVATLLSLVGVYSVAALGVSARSNEIAIRSCLGAQPNDIVRLVLLETGIAVASAVAAGAAGAWLLQRQMGALVYGVESTDWLAIAASAFVLSTFALAAVYVAVRRVVVMRPLDLLKHGAGALA